MHKVKAKGILSASNGINIYRGCLHGCIYCDSRSDCYQMKHKFEDIEVKENAPELLEKALSSKRKPCMIGTGAMSDPYIPLEKDLRIMRKCLEIIENILSELPFILNRQALCVILIFLKKLIERANPYCK